ncbi:hypothetical protein HQ865_20205 [Mucilaginibacter mali]|uniref:Uncharacterized protein n=1 Tax=Mucilaginibacter mali TaxID=2740462 RepID=A0A7D4PVX7_9SPHI|nr:hypothetical protein [Mucilaginibacter mali]QKJ31988.1 hypothetical protein HQ865_20205 [Mucilaginibacter mali]
MASAGIIHEQKIFLKYHGYNNIDSLQIPVVSDKYPQLKQAIAEQLFDGHKSYDIVERYEADGHGITGVWYEVTYQDSNIISLIIYYETMGARPSGYQKWLTYDINTGQPYPLAKEIDKAGLKNIFLQYKLFIQKGIAAARKDIARDTSLTENEVEALMNSLNYAKDKLTPEVLFEKYVFTDKGVRLSSADVLPHAVRNYDIERNWLIPYQKLRPFRTYTGMVIK